MATIGVRELRQQTSELLRRVKEEQAEYVITYQGRPVAVLLPLDADAIEAAILQVGKRGAGEGWDAMPRWSSASGRPGLSRPRLKRSRMRSAARPGDVYNRRKRADQRAEPRGAGKHCQPGLPAATRGTSSAYLSPTLLLVEMASALARALNDAALALEVVEACARCPASSGFPWTPTWPMTRPGSVLKLGSADRMPSMPQWRAASAPLWSRAIASSSSDSRRSSPSSRPKRS